MGVFYSAASSQDRHHPSTPSFDDKTEVRGKMAEVVKRAVGSATFFDGVHVFTPHADVPDDTALRLIVLPPEGWYSRDEARIAFDAVLDTLRKNGAKPRYRSNRLIFLAADHGTLSRLNVRTKLKEIYRKGGQSAVGAMGFFEDTLRYLYLPRFKNHDVLAQAIRSGTASRDFFGTAYGQSEGKFEGFQLGGGDVVFDDALPLIEPEAAKAYEETNRPASPQPEPPPGPPGMTPSPGLQPPFSPPGITPGTAKAHSFHGTAEVPPATAKMRLVQLADEIVSVLCSDPNASVRLVVEISAEFPDGATDNLKRAVSENARSLNLKSADWE